MPLSQEAFISGAEQVNGRVEPFDQAVLGDRPFMSRGVCRALGTLWLRDQKRRRRRERDIAEARRMEELSWLAEQQQVGNPQETTDTYMRGNGLRPDGNIFFSRAVNWEKLWFFLAAKQGYYLVGANPVGHGAGHEIAFNTDNTFMLFDANYGEATFRDANGLKFFFSTYWRRAYPELVAGRASILRYL